MKARIRLPLLLPEDPLSRLARLVQTEPTYTRMEQLQHNASGPALAVLAQYTSDREVRRAMLEEVLSTLPRALPSYPTQIPFLQWVPAWVRTFWETHTTPYPEPAVSPLAPPDRLSKEACPHSIGWDTCKRVRAELKENPIPSGGPDSPRIRLKACPSCTLPAAAESLARASTERASSLLRTLGFDLYYPNSGPSIPDRPYHCELLHVDIVEPCTVSSCASYVAYPWSQNCLHVHLRMREVQLQERRKKERVNPQEPACTPHEIAVLLHRPVAEIEQGLKLAMGQARSHILLRQLHDGSIEADFEDLSSARLCVACERPLTKQAVSVQDLSYCSKHCVEELPPPYVRVERLYQRPYAAMVRYAHTLFSTPEDVYGALRLPLPPKIVASTTPEVPETSTKELLRSSSRERPMQILKRTGRKPAWLIDLEHGIQRRLDTLAVPGFRLAVE